MILELIMEHGVKRMPRISRVRLHNIRYGKERRVFDNLIFDLREGPACLYWKMEEARP